MDKTLRIMIAAAEAGGQILRRYFGQPLKVTEKSIAADFRTRADVESEDAIVSLLTKNFPQYSIFAEERGLIGPKSDWQFVIDPLDGSNNYLIGIPQYSVSLALLKGDQVRYAVTHNPTRQLSYYAIRGGGAFVDGKKIHVSSESNIKRVTVGYACGYLDPQAYFTQMIGRLNQKNVKRVLVDWSPCLDFCLLAEGKIESFYNSGSQLYDYIAGKLITKEAGAIIKEFPGQGQKGDCGSKFLVSNCQEIHQQVLACL